MNQLDQITSVIRQAVKESTNKNMSLQSAKALAAKIMGERNMHAASAKSPEVSTGGHDGYTWHVVGHYDDNNQPFSALVRARDGFSALLEVADRARKEAQEADEEPQDTLILHSAINAFTGEVVYPSDESGAGTYLSDLYEHIDAGFEPFSFSHAAHPQGCELEVNALGGYVVKVKASEKDDEFLYIDGKANSALIDQFQKTVDALREQSALEKEFARIDAMSAWDSDPVYPIEDWQHEVHDMDTTLSYKEWVKNKYEMNQGETGEENLDQDD